MSTEASSVCTCADYAKYKLFYDDAMNYERSLYREFAQFLLLCAATGVVLCFLFVVYTRLRQVKDTPAIATKLRSSPKIKLRRSPTKKPTASNSPVPATQRDSISSTSSSEYPASSTVYSSDSRRSSDDSSCSNETSSLRRPVLGPARQSFKRMIFTIKDLPQRVQDEMQVPSFVRKPAVRPMMKRSHSTGKIIEVPEPLCTPPPTYPSTPGPRNAPPVFTTPFTSGSGSGGKRRLLLADNNGDAASLSPLAPNPSPLSNSLNATVHTPERRPSPAVLQSAEKRSAASPRRPGMNLARSFHDLKSSMGPRSPSSLKIPQFPRRSPGRQGSNLGLGLHV